ncbi:YigZ family protein [Vibrio sp. S17_S38]|uniref:YigZ family protein n=1 Tax=Vibrio sp. S17_S38 TaxID=2720229 RepID=UPI001681991E|nr:YigZ family protein [Vibrio sp. S17_S38]MBD1574460.1 YigZ family protein [Vibrio sp. S17_S38]
MNDHPYLIPFANVVFEEEIKKSIFITHLAHTPSIEIAKTFIAQIKDLHINARHNCWGFAAGRADNSLLWGFSDDGEPSGTAGKPILAQVSGSGIGELTAVVTRYSGGIKLGTGGLVKAYGGGVQQALKLLQTIERKITTQVHLELDYAEMPLVQSMIMQYQALQIGGDFSARIKLIVEIEKRELATFSQELVNKSGARVQIRAL